MSDRLRDILIRDGFDHDLADEIVERAAIIEYSEPERSRISRWRAGIQAQRLYLEQIHTTIHDM